MTEQLRQDVVSVSEFVRHARTLVESAIPLGWVGGEVSNLVRAASGHVYFTLKDAQAQLRCAMWRNRAQLLGFQLTEGMQVEVRAQLTVYEARGDLQLSVESVRRAGQGGLYEAWLRLKAKLEAEGLFEAAHKRALPTLPAGVAIVTSPQAAALRDVLACLRRRAPAMRICLYPTAVQGEAAGEAIAAAITQAGARAAQDGCEALIVCRGGGSIEDLWAFNDERVVRALRACALPSISGVGHETDVTLCDFAADLRAATPTAAAELLSGGHVAWREQLPQLAGRLTRAAWQVQRAQAQRVDYLQRRLRHPRERVQLALREVGALGDRMRRALGARLDGQSHGLSRLAASLRAERPDLAARRLRLQGRQDALQRLWPWQLARLRMQSQALAQRLVALNPQAVLARGYAIVRDAQGRVLRSAAAVVPGARIDIALGDGNITAEVCAAVNDERALPGEASKG